MLQHLNRTVNSAEELKSDMTTLKLDIVINVNDLKSDMTTILKSNHDDLMSRIGEFDVRMNKVEKLTTSISSMVQTANTRNFENSKNWRK